MNFIKRILLPITLCVLLSSCGTHSSVDTVAYSDKSSSKITNKLASAVIFTYDGKDYDLQERNSDVNAFMAETSVGDAIVIEGHIGPQNGYYGIFDTNTKTFVKDIVGANLTWKDDDISTAVYNFWSEIYDYDGNLLANLNLPESEYINDLLWKDSEHLSVEICSVNDETRNIKEVEVNDTAVPTEEYN